MHVYYFVLWFLPQVIFNIFALVTGDVSFVA